MRHQAGRQRHAGRRRRPVHVPGHPGDAAGGDDHAQRVGRPRRHHPAALDQRRRQHQPRQQRHAGEQRRVVERVAGRQQGDRAEGQRGVLDQAAPQGPRQRHAEDDHAAGHQDQGRPRQDERVLHGRHGPTSGAGGS